MPLIKQRRQKVPVEVKEVDHMAVSQAVDHIAHRATQNQCQRKAKQFLRGVAAQHPQNKPGCHHANTREKPALPTRSVGEHGKRRSAVVYPHQIEIRCDGLAVPPSKAVHDQQFGDLIDQQHHQSNAQPQQHRRR